MPRIYFEDLLEGRVFVFGPRTITREEIVGFAAEFDPQPMHLDEEAAKQTMLGGLAASGWHLCVVMMKMVADGFLLDSSSMGAPGVEEVRWLKPVRPGDSLSAHVTVLEQRVSKSRPEMGLVRLQIELFNQAKEKVMYESHTHLFGRRTGETAAQ